MKIKDETLKFVLGIGTLVGLISSLVLKHVDLYFNPSLEFALMLCFVYIPYAFAEGIHLSGKYFLFYNLT